MPFEDEWGHDPSVQSMRRVFSWMEEAQQELLGHLDISLFDKRLRNVRGERERCRPFLSPLFGAGVEFSRD